MTRLKQDCGQAYVITVLFLAVLLGMTAAVLDVGSWYRADRALQATADASALAGAQALPDNPAQAELLALEYADKNGGGVGVTDISFSSAVLPADTVTVVGERPAPGFFAKILGIDSVTVHGTATARAGYPGEARYVAPITVSKEHPMLVCKPICFGVATEIELMDLHKPGSGDAAGAFGLLNLDTPNGNGTPGSEEVASWMSEGYDAYMPLGNYRSVPSTEFNSSHFQGALKARVGDEVLFPIYRPPIKKSGQNAEFDIIGWVGFFVTGSQVKGDKGKVFGHFTKVIWEGILAKSGGPLDDYGVRVIELVE